MILLDVIEVAPGSNTKRIELHQGDLASLQPGEAVDVLILSAFPNDYTPTRASLIGALYRKGVNVSDLARSKAVDLRTAFSCWLSANVSSRDPGIQFRRILCFEPSSYRSPAAFIGDIFRALAPFLGDNPPITSVAMPLITSGGQGYPVSHLLPHLIEAAVHWLRAGWPLDCLKIVAYSDQLAHEAKTLFVDLKKKYEQDDSPKSPKYEFDVFLSYSHTDTRVAERIRDTLNQRKLRLFFDTNTLDTGVAWQQRLFSALDSCEKVIALYSPDYVTSKVCQEEFNIAWARARKNSADIIYPLYWRSAELPTYMELLNFVDCRETNEDRILDACDTLTSKFRQ